MVHGTYYFGKKRVACRNAYCTTCKAARFAEGIKSLVVLHFCFIPILPIAMKIRWFCRTCEHEIDAHRPNSRFILIAGVFCSALITLLGVMGLINGDEMESTAGPLLFGPLMAGGLVYLLRKPDFANFVAAQQAVVPLDGSHCPYCKAPVFAATKPHCHACRVDIIAK